MFDWSQRHSYRAASAPWPDGYPADQATYFSPEDGEGIHRLITDLINSASRSIRLNMYGFDDDDANKALLSKVGDPNVYFQMNLDKSQAGGVHEREILAQWNHDAFGTSIAIGQSARHAISHLKVLVIDGEYVVSGSTNWSLSGEEQQDNQLTVVHNAILAVQFSSILDINHTEMLKQMAAATASTTPTAATGGAPA